MIIHKNYYSILNVPDKASPEDIGKAYRKLALKSHPDITHDNSDRFRELTEAYEILKDPDKRKQYDKILKFSLPKAVRVRRGSDILISLKITADDIAKERTKNILTTRKVPCSVCSGTGASTKKMIRCSKCNGSGIDIVSSVMGPKKTCIECRGFGNYPQDNCCTKCNGTGLVPEKIARQVTISRDFSHSLTIPGSGNYPSECGQGGIYGNLIVSFNIEKSYPFEFDGKFIRGTYKISPAQAILGDTVFVEVFGEDIEINIPAGTKPGDVVEKEKEKAIIIRDKQKILCLKMIVDTSAKITEEEKTLYKQLLKLQKGYL